MLSVQPVGYILNNSSLLPVIKQAPRAKQNVSHVSGESLRCSWSLDFHSYFLIFFASVLFFSTLCRQPACLQNLSTVSPFSRPSLNAALQTRICLKTLLMSSSSRCDFPLSSSNVSHVRYFKTSAVHSMCCNISHPYGRMSAVCISQI